VNNGEYRVTLQATDNDGGVTEASFVTSVGNLAPLANAGPDQVSNEGELVAFHGSATDPGVLDELTYAWDLDYDGVTFTPDRSGPMCPRRSEMDLPPLVAKVEDGDGGKLLTQSIWWLTT
jgi:hypothetical protein